MNKLRTSASGPLVVGSANGDVLIWDAALGDWIPGAVPGGGAVDSVFGRAGVVVAVGGDYDSDEVTNASGVAGATVSDALDALAAAIPAVPVASVFGRVGAVAAALNDYAASLVANDSGVAGATVKAALDTLAAAIPAVPVASVFGRVGAVVAVAGDYTSTTVTNSSSVTGATVTLALNALLAANIPLEIGAALADATATIATDVQRSLLAGVLTAARVLTITPSATPNRAFPLLIGTQGFSYTLRNGGSLLGDTVIPAGTRVVAWVTSDGGNVQITTTKIGQEPI